MVTSCKCVLYEFITTFHDRYRPKCRFCSQRLHNGHFFTTHDENQTVPLILVFFWETFKDDDCFYYYKSWFSTLDRRSMRSNLEIKI